MTVTELIKLLTAYPRGMRVVVNGYEESYDDLSPEQISSVKVALNTGKHSWKGEHGDPNGLGRSALDDEEVVEVLVLRRVSN